MTREQAKELLPIIQAYSEGKIIQTRYKTDSHLPKAWIDHLRDDELKFDLVSFKHIDYRIKPEPREFWLVDSTCGDICDRGSKGFQGFHVYTIKQYTPLKQIHVKEIID